MEPSAMTDYERRRLENIKRNDEKMASMKLRLKANVLSSAIKSKRKGTTGHKTKPEKKPKTESSGVIRRSFRARGISPEAPAHKGVKDDLIPSRRRFLDSSSFCDYMDRKKRYLSMKDARISRAARSDLKFTDSVISMSKSAPLELSAEKREKIFHGKSFNPVSLVLKPDNVARILPWGILNVDFFPSEEKTVIVVGDKLGNVGFWDVYAEGGEGVGVYAYGPHSAPVSGISIQPFCLSKILTSGHDGLIRMMDVNKEMFSTVYSSDGAIFSLSRRPNDIGSLYFGEGQGELKVWDERAGNISSSYTLHALRINSIDFNFVNNNLVATSSKDGTACIWDLRNINPHHPKSLKTVDFQSSVHSAYFSPNGNSLATTSYDDKIGLLSGADFEDVTLISHSNQTSAPISSFRAIWGWDDQHLFVGNNKRAVDVISTVGRTTVSLESHYMTQVPCLFAAHPSRIGMLAGATAGGHVYMWTAK